MKKGPFVGPQGVQVDDRTQLDTPRRSALQDDPFVDPDERQLLDEWLSYPGLTSRSIRALKEAGVSPSAWIAAGSLTTPRVQPVGRLYLPDPFGHSTFALRVVDGRPPSWKYLELDPLADLLAFRLDEPERWWLRRGRVGLVLGLDQLAEAFETRSSINIHATPLDWLRASCVGVCPLDLAEDFQDAARFRARMAGLAA